MSRIVRGFPSLGGVVAEHARRVLLLSGASDRAQERVQHAIFLLQSQGVEALHMRVHGSILESKQVVEGCNFARQAGVDGIVALGGGAVLDAGKIIAALQHSASPNKEWNDCVPVPCLDENTGKYFMKAQVVRVT
jgi:alcohol dehydrogenase